MAGHAPHTGKPSHRGVASGIPAGGLGQGPASGFPARGERPPFVVNTAASPAHPLYGKHVTFTGGLDSMPRQVAWDWLGSVGGIPEASMNKRTNILVIGPDFYRGEVLDGDLLTGKMAKAAALRAKGHPIEIMSEDDFLRSL